MATVERRPGATATRRARARRRALRGLADSRALPWVTTPLIVVLLVVLWELYVAVTGVSEFVLPPPQAVARALGEQLTSGFVWRQHIWTTFYETVLGFAIALVVGVVLGFVMGASRTIQAIANPFVVATQVVPKVALVPLFILWFGFGPTSKVAISATLAFFPILTNTAFGVRSVTSSMREMMTSLGATRWQRLRTLELPATLPNVLTGAEVGVVLATIGAIVGEYLAGDRGLGRYAVTLQNNLQIPELYGAIVLMTLLGFVLYVAVAALRRLLVPWHESVLVTQRHQA
jgi:NitT/TauT family transport system permease protein